MGAFDKPKAQQPRPDARQQNGQIIQKPKHCGPEDHNQYIRDPLAHFLAIPWAAKLLTDPAAFDIVVSDRRSLPSGDKQFVRSVISSEKTVRACVTFLLKVPPQKEEGQRGVCPAPPFDGLAAHGPTDAEGKLISKSKKLLEGGGPENGEDPDKPFVLSNVFVDLGEGLCGYRGMLHGGALMVLLDEAMCAAADNQSKYAYTASMTTTFLKPVTLPGVVLVRSRVVKVEGRKLWVRGCIEDSDGNVMAESEAMLIDKTPGRWSKL